MNVLQPKFPPRYDALMGPYEAIRDVKESLRWDLTALLYTSPGSHPYRPNLGIGIKNYLFELSTSPVWADLQQRIVDQVRNYIDGINIIDVSVDFDMEGETVDNNTAIIKIAWEVSRTGDRNILTASIDELTGEALIDYVDYSSSRGATDEYIDGAWQPGTAGAVDGRPW